MDAVARSTSTLSWEAVERFTSRSVWARKHMRWWVGGVQRSCTVVPRVLSHRTSVVDGFRQKDIDDLQKRIAADPALHALGDLNKKTDVAPSARVKDGTSPYAVMHVFHMIVEATGGLPTITEMRAHPLFQDLLAADLEKVVDESVAEDHVSRQVAERALDWRIGNFYYALAKEQWTIAVMRDEGLDVRQHVLADVLFGVDFWIQNLNFSLYVMNDEFRNGSIGRRITAEDNLRDADPQFENLDIKLPVKNKFGVIHLPDEQETRRLARVIAGRTA